MEQPHDCLEGRGNEFYFAKSETNVRCDGWQHSESSRGPEVLGQRSYQRRRQAEIDPSGERSNRLLVLLVALMVYPLALKVTTLESQGSPVYSWATVL